MEWEEKERKEKDKNNKKRHTDKSMRSRRQDSDSVHSTYVPLIAFLIGVESYVAEVSNFRLLSI